MNVITLSNGVELFDLCFGTGIVSKNTNPLYKMKCVIRDGLKDKKQRKIDNSFRSVITTAMKYNCHMFDTARAYGGAEYELGKALNSYDRSDYKIITKLCNDEQFKKNVRGSLEKSLHELNMDYVDLYLMHWPVTDYFLDSWKEMEKLYKEGMCKAIGVCNCNIHHLNELESVAEIMPMVNEFECHPLFTQKELREYCKEKNIQVMAYTSTGRMDERLKKTVLVPLAKKYNKSIAQIILRWHQQIGNIPIINSVNPKHMVENTNIYDFNLSNEEIASIESININSRLRYDPDNCDFKQL